MAWFPNEYFIDNLQCGSQIFSMLRCITGFVVPNMTKDNHAFIFKCHGVKKDEGTKVLLKHSVTSLKQSKTNTQREIAFLPGHELLFVEKYFLKKRILLRNFTIVS
jgi:hypothetical protein